MNEWKSININTQNIEYSTDWSTRIKCPKQSAYNGYSIWISNKLIHDGRHNYAISVSYTDDFKFKLIKYGKGRYNKNQKLEEIEINAALFEEIFGVMNDSIKEAKCTSLLIHKPNEVLPVEEKVDKDLLDD